MPTTSEPITARPSELTVRPDAPAWRAALTSFRLSPEARRFREQLGLPVDKPIVMTGHQAQVWHPGILAKYVAADVAAERFGASSVWIIVDQDTHDPCAIRYPIVTDGKAMLAARMWRADGAERAWGERYPEVPVGLTPAFRPGALPDDLDHGAAPHVREGMIAIRDALARHADKPSAARQIGAALTDLLAGIVRPAPVIYALELCRTDLFKSLIQRIMDDPARCIESYQRAVRAHASAKVAPLHDGELPLWAIPEVSGAARKRATIAMLTSGSTCRLAPRALMMTAMLRMAGCEVFVHGLGGGGGGVGGDGYDAITDEWVGDWLGVNLPPVAVVTATVRLNFDSARSTPTPTPEQIAHAHWLAHAARHRPILLDEVEADAVRVEAVGTMKRLRWKRDEESRRAKRAAYRTLQEVLGAVRGRHAVRLGALDEQARAAAERREEAEIISDRTWAFPLYEPGQIAGLREAVGARLGA